MAESIPWGTGPGTPRAFTTLSVARLVAARLAALPPDDGPRSGGEVRQ
jgi:hypothetical protein